MALLGDDRVLVAGEHGLVALLPSGRIDSSFGNHGYAPMVDPPDGTASASVVAVDGQGRPVEVGSVYAEPEGGGILTGPRSEPFLERFTPAGQIDHEFGGGAGYVVDDLGLPGSADGEPAESFLDDVAFDAAGRLVATGQSRIDVSRGEGGVFSVRRAFVARFGRSGKLDSSFAGGGVFSPAGTQKFSGDWALGPRSQIIVGTTDGTARSILRVGQDGAPDDQFGNHGYAPNLFGSDYAPLLLDPAGRTIAYTYVEGVEHRLPNGIVLKRLRPDGSPDRSFGDGGAATVRIPRFYTADVGLDSRGRILVVASRKERGPVGEPKELALVRLGTDGKVESSFGQDGMIRIPFPGRRHPSVYLEGIDVRNGQVAIGASYCGSGAECRPTVTLVDLGSG